MFKLGKLFGPTPEEQSRNKQMLLGGIASSLIYWGNVAAEQQLPEYPAELKQQIVPYLPTNGELIAGIAPPAALYAIFKYGKKAKLKYIAKGSILFGVPNIIARTAVQTLYEAGKPAATARLPMQMNNMNNMSKYATNTARSVPPMTSGLSKYAMTA